MRRFRDLVLGLVLTAAGASGAYAGCGGWAEVKDTSPYWLESIAHAPERNTFIAVGRDGLVFRSADGRRWSMLKGCTQVTLRRVIWAGGRFVAVGEADVVLTSADGKDWAAQTLQQTGNLSGIAGNGSRYVIVGVDETILTSPDGIDWTRVRGRESGADLLSVRWLRNRFYAVGKGATMLASADGQQWAPTGPGGDQELVDIAATEQLFVIATGDGHAYTSADGIDWAWPTQGQKNRDVWDLEAIATSGEVWLGVGYKGGLLRVERDGKTWEKGQLEQRLWLRDVTWTGKAFVAVGKRGSVFSSPDGRTWELLSGGVAPKEDY